MGDDSSACVAIITVDFCLLPLILLRGRSLEVLELGDEVAVGLGVKLKRTQLFFLICAVCLAAVSVSVAGSISFIGLIAPHIARQVTGKKNNQTLIMSALIGGGLLLFSDILARVILPMVRWQQELLSR